MEYKIGQIVFGDRDFIHAAEWCNTHGAEMEDMDPDADGRRRFRIVKTDTEPSYPAPSLEQRIAQLEDELSRLKGEA